MTAQFDEGLNLLRDWQQREGERTVHLTVEIDYRGVRFQAFAYEKSDKSGLATRRDPVEAARVAIRKAEIERSDDITEAS